jgi:thiol-disulfide isomerase/thioredoxin
MEIRKSKLETDIRGRAERVSSFKFRVSKRAQRKNPFLRLIWIAVLAGWMLAAGCSRSAVPPEPPPPAGIINLDEQDWQGVRARHRGRVLLVNFWATWCEPCREEFPAIVRLHQNYRTRGLSVVAISMDEPESLPAIERFLKAQGAQFGSYLHHFRDFSALVDSINPRWGGGIPATFLYDPQGRLVESWEGATSYAEFERAVRPLLPGEEP